MDPQEEKDSEMEF
jgi:hypothetical protein